MARFVLTAEAKSDLEQIWQYIAAESEIAADRAIAELVKVRKNVKLLLSIEP